MLSYGYFVAHRCEPLAVVATRSSDDVSALFIFLNEILLSDRVVAFGISPISRYSRNILEILDILDIPMLLSQVCSRFNLWM